MTRTKYMQQVMNDTYPLVAIEAIRNGFDGSWERLIATQLIQDKRQDVSEAVVILESVGNDSMKAAKLILDSKPKGVDLNSDKVKQFLNNNH